jgi:predicted acetyltransferase
MHQVTLENATSRDSVLLANLMELYIHDMSAMFPHVKLGEDGRFGYPDLPRYLAGESNRCAFVIRDAGRIAGFVLARRGSPASDDPSVLDVAEFFVLRQFRARGVGRAAAARLWDRMRGNWTVRAALANPAAVKFWRNAAAEYTGQTATESERTIGTSQWVVFSFDNQS